MRYWEWPNTGVGTAVNIYVRRCTPVPIGTPLATDPNIPPNWCGLCTGGLARLDWTPNNGGRLQIDGCWDDSMYVEAQEISTDPDYRAALDDLWTALPSERSAG